MLKRLLLVLVLLGLSSAELPSADGDDVGIGGMDDQASDEASPRPKTFKELDAACARLKSAKAVLAAWNAFLADAGVPQSEHALAKLKLEYLNGLADSGAVRIKGQWISPDEVAKPDKEEARLMREAWAALDVRDAKLCESKFLSASRSNPVGILANFSLAMLYSLNARKPAVAEQNFRECVKRRDELVGSTETMQRDELAAALNNLGIVQVRQKKFDAALKNWQAAADANGPAAEIIQNIGRLSYIGSNPRGFKVTKSSANKATELYTRLAASADDVHFEPHIGWLFMDIVDVTRPDIKIKLEDRSCMHCSGIGRLDCPDCSKGVQTLDSYSIVGQSTLTGQRVVTNSTKQKKCPTCNGKGTIDCKLCYKGVDSTLTGEKTRKSSKKK